MTNPAVRTQPQQVFTAPLDLERLHFKKVELRAVFSDLVIPQSYLRRFQNPSADTSFPLEYAFHLLGDLQGKTVVDLGCGDGVIAIVLASLGARVIAVDISDKSLELAGDRAEANGVRDRVTLVHCDAARIPVADGSVDRVLCAAMLQYVDSIATARQIRRILKPGGIAAFMEPLAGPEWMRRLRMLFPKPGNVIGRDASLTLEQTFSVSRAVGRGGRRREFMLTSRVLERLGVRSFSTMKRSHELDSWILNRCAFTRALASPLVWEAQKER